MSKSKSELKPELKPGERVLTRFKASRNTYIREHVMLAALGAVIMSGGLIAIGNPYPWTGVVGSVFAISIRGFYVASEQLGFVWTLTNQRLIGPAERDIALSRIKTVNTMFSAAQVVTHNGDKYLLRYQEDAAATKAAILQAAGVPQVDKGGK